MTLPFRKIRAHSTWVDFCNVITRHRRGFMMRLPYDYAVDLDAAQMAKCLCMVPLPEGHPNAPSPLIEEWINDR